MIKIILLASLIIMALIVVTQQAKAYPGQIQIEGAMKEQIFNKGCMAEGNLSSVTSILSLSRCPIAWDKMTNGTQLLDECEKKLHLSMDKWTPGDLEKC